MSHDVKISVIIPAFNEQTLITRAISSVSSADEIIVVDGGSDDNTILHAESAHAKVIHGQKGRGLQLRTGASKATGDVFVFLHADSWMSEDALAQIRQFVSEQFTNESEHFFGCLRQRIDETHFCYRILEFGNQIRATWLRLPYGDQAMFVSRKTYDQVDGIDAVPLMEDVLFSRKARKLCRPTLLSAQVHLSSRRWRQRGVVRQTIKNWVILGAFFLGVSPIRLAQWYR